MNDGIRNIQYRKISWDEIESGVDEISNRINHDFVMSSVDVIVPIARGGLVPGRLVSERINVNKMCCLTARFYKEDGKQSESVEIEYTNGDWDFKGRNVLVVDDISDSGRTLMGAVGYLKGLEFGPKRILTATIYHKDRSDFVPDYYYQVLWDNDWIVFPWEFNQMVKVGKSC